jgi:type VI secretion system (T6SS) effector TldE1-like protein
MYTYHQSTGLLARDGVAQLHGYAGHGSGVNNPAMQDTHDIGPLPQGRYVMTALIDSPHTGLATIILDSDPGNQMFGRSGFRIHGDNAAANRTASNGCIIAGHAPDRTGIWNSGDRSLEVIA